MHWFWFREIKSLPLITFEESVESLIFSANFLYRISKRDLPSLGACIGTSTSVLGSIKSLASAPLIQTLASGNFTGFFRPGTPWTPK